ncbi:DUF2628 domain-containing protein [Xenorhabdus bovienii]|uniref:DUF2628 domain-containing protein n=1 Tax=Xenorhabdus bovienii TaxID=40576 RepID=UPI0023B2CD62|nr:DUF2628 domain-containing protein [Xenorhabdus bovienii]MDE9564267.1 DUF2628 domain-containing protein [Xenorhabdus bovienii]
MDISKYSEKWQERFKFFEKNGAPPTQEYREAYRKTPFLKRLKIDMNFIALFFGIFYYLIIGLWKKGLILLGINIAVFSIMGIFGVISGIDISDNIYNAMGVAFSLLNGYIANYAYYLKEIKGDDGWNPFKGIFTK